MRQLSATSQHAFSHTDQHKVWTTVIILKQQNALLTSLDLPKLIIPDPQNCEHSDSVWMAGHA